MEQQQQNVAILRPGEVDQRMVQNGFKIAIFNKERPSLSMFPLQYSTLNKESPSFSMILFAKCHILFPSIFGCITEINVPKNDLMPNINPHLERLTLGWSRTVTNSSNTMVPSLFLSICSYISWKR